MERSKVRPALRSEAHSVNKLSFPVLGDAGMTRGDEFFGDNHSFNQTLFDKVRSFVRSFSPGAKKPQTC
jgi:hypothetical protein